MIRVPSPKLACVYSRCLPPCVWLCQTVMYTVINCLWDCGTVFSFINFFSVWINGFPDDIFIKIYFTHFYLPLSCLTLILLPADLFLFSFLLLDPCALSSSPSGFGSCVYLYMSVCVGSGFHIGEDTIPSRLMHFSAYGMISFFFMTEWHSIVYMCHIFFIHSTVDGLLGCFHFLAIMHRNMDSQLRV